MYYDDATERKNEPTNTPDYNTSKTAGRIKVLLVSFKKGAYSS